MKISDIIRLAALNLYRRLARTFLTVIGVVIGTACIVIMIAIGLTNLHEYDEMLQNFKLTEIEVYTNHMSNSALGAVRLDDAAIMAFGQIQHVKTVVPIMEIPAHAAVDKYKASYFRMQAVPPEVIKEIAELDKGRYYRASSTMPEIVMGRGAARRFIESEDDYHNRDYEGPGLDWLQTPIEIYLGHDYGDNGAMNDMPSSRMYRTNVVGLLVNEHEEYPTDDIYISLDVAKRMIQENYKLANKINLKENTYDQVKIYADDMDNVSEILKTIKDYGFEAYSDTQYIDNLKEQQHAQQTQLAAIGFISLLVSAIGIANTMMTGILERRREIGVMKVVGMAVPKIRRLFLIESAMIGLVGGVIGVLLSHVLGYLMSTGADATQILGTRFDTGMKMLMPLWLDMAAIGVAVVVGVIAGIFPARKATKMSPLEAIRAA